MSIKKWKKWQQVPSENAGEKISRNQEIWPELSRVVQDKKLNFNDKIKKFFNSNADCRTGSAPRVSSA